MEKKDHTEVKRKLREETARTEQELIKKYETLKLVEDYWKKGLNEGK